MKARHARDAPTSTLIGYGVRITLCARPLTQMASGANMASGARPTQQQRERMDLTKLRQHLHNWGDWLNHDAEIGPAPERCISIESTYVPEAGDVFETDRETHAIPNVADAEAINRHIQRLDYLQVFCLSLRYGGIPAVIRMRRISEDVQNKQADNAETLLADIIGKRK